MKSINPVNGEVLKEYAEHDADQVRDKLRLAENAFESWKRIEFSERAFLMNSAATVLRERSQEYATLMAQEMGKPIKQGIAEAEKCAWVCEYYAEHAASFLHSEIVETDAKKSYITFRPLGAILAVMPWNFPLWQVFRFAAQAIMAGNVGVLKHASNVSGCALAIEDVFRQAGFPDHVFTTLLIGNKLVNSVIEDSRIKAVTLTGSEPAGRAVAEKAGHMLKKTVLELGGSDPYIVFKDADLSKTVSTCVNSRLINSGQSCIAAKRFIVPRKILDAFEKLFVAKFKAVQVGDPMDEKTHVGPQARHDLRDDLHVQVLKSIQQGATCLLGGKVDSDPGAFYPPTVLTNVKKGMPAYDEELFGPVAAIIPVNDENEAIQVANDSRFGLGAALFTQDLKRGEEVITNQIEAGSVFLNSFVKSDPRLPFGGIKQSGYGRELSHVGIKEFVNIKTIYMA